MENYKAAFMRIYCLLIALPPNLIELDLPGRPIGLVHDEEVPGCASVALAAEAYQASLSDILIYVSPHLVLLFLTN